MQRWLPLLNALVLAAATCLGAGCDRGASGRAPAAPGSVTPAPVPLRLDAVAVIGASVSAGAEVSLPGLPPKMFGGDATLADVLAAATESPTPPSFADMMFFARPSEIAEKQLAAVREIRPRIVFAIDYLFWHAYGGPMSDAARRRLFAKGLERLGSLDATLVVADLPDMSHAVGSLLSSVQVPPSDLLEEFNRDLERWASERSNVVLVRLRQTVADAMAQRPTSLGGHIFDGAAARGLLTPNGLHTTADGQVCLGLECLRRLREAGIVPAHSVWTTGLDTIKQRIIEAKRSGDGGKVGSPLPSAGERSRKRQDRLDQARSARNPTSMAPSPRLSHRTRRSMRSPSTGCPMISRSRRCREAIEPCRQLGA